MNITKKLGLLVMVMLLVSCSTQKNTSLTRTYHNVTSRFNILFNGKEAFKEGLNRYNDAYKDDYSRLLPVFRYGDEQAAARVGTNMERTIEKASKVIREHSITVKPEKKKSIFSEKDKSFYNKLEYNKYVDDSYLLLGKSQFYQMDYLNAEKTFNYMLGRFDDEDNYLWTNIWLARTFIQLNNYSDAKKLLNRLTEADEVRRKTQIGYLKTLADYFIKTEQRQQALEPLELALELTRKKSEKVRLSYILAQLHAEFGNYSKADQLFSNVIRKNPDYEMQFNARLNQLNYSTELNDQDRIKALNKMLKDDKNIDLRDQVYYTLGNIHLDKGRENEAIHNYKKSVSSSVSNDNQKGLSFLSLADIYFENKDYVNAQAYYDSTVNVINEDYPGYTELYIKTQNLSRLVENIKEVEKQDSLQYLASLEPEERDKLIQQFINAVVEQEKQEQEARQNQQENIMFTSTSRRYNSNFGDNGKWYFYSPTARSYGEPDFKRRWGDRKLEDNWRRSNKRAISFNEELAEGMEGETQNPITGPINNKSKEYYLKDLPMNDSLLEVSNNKVEIALFNIAVIYQNDFKEYQKSIDAYKELIDRFPESDYKIISYFYLYKVYEEIGDEENANLYKNLILKRYPDSKFAKYFTDPNYLRNLEKFEEESFQNYLTTLSHYNEGKYLEVINDCNKAFSSETDAELLPKYNFLYALASGKIYGNNQLKSQLSKVIEQFPADDVSERANEILKILQGNELKYADNRQRAEVASDPVSDSVRRADDLMQTVRETSVYEYNIESKFYFVLVINKSIDVNQLKFDFINFNLDYYLQKDYVVESKALNDVVTGVSVKRFESQEEASDYYNTFKSKEDKVMSNFENMDYMYFYISVENYIQLYKEQSIGSYMDFFFKNYPL